MEFAIVFDKEEEKLRRELSMLLSTRAGSVPVIRDYGISWQCLDAPPDVAESLFYQELLQKTEKYLPNIKIVGIEFVHNPENGEATAKISCRRRESSE